MADERSNYPEFPYRSSFVEAQVSHLADETNAALKELSFQEGERYQRMRQFVTSSVIAVFSEAGIDIKPEDLYRVYLVQKDRKEELKAKTGFSDPGEAHQIGKAVHVLVGDDMLTNTYITLEELIHCLGTSRIIVGRGGRRSLTNQAGLITKRGENISGSVLEEGIAGYEPTMILKKAAREGKLKALGVSDADINLMMSSTGAQINQEIAKRINSRPIYHSVFLLMDRLIENAPQIHHALLRARFSDESRGELVRLIDSIHGKGTAKKIFSLDFSYQKREIEDLTRLLAPPPSFP